jgi:hypothetical protein
VTAVTRLLTTALLLATLFTATALRSPTGTQAAASTLYVSQTCAPDGVAVNFGWDGQDPAAIQVWIDISLADNGFAPGTFISAGPLPGWSTSYLWRGIRPGFTHFVRVNIQHANGSWDPSGTFIVASQTCGGTSVPIGTPGGIGRPSIQNVTCTSSFDTGSIANINPTDRKQTRLNASTAETIRCVATATGAYSSLAWRGPNGEEGFGPTFVTTAGPLRQPNVPNVISLRLNWDGNPALADINVYIVAPAIQTNCPPYYGIPYNPALYPCGLSGPY